MKIAYDHQIFGSQRFGGISRYFFELANHLDGARDGAIQCQIVRETLQNHPSSMVGVSPACHTSTS